MVELYPVPRRAPMTGRLWLLAAAVVLAPVVLFAVAPTVLGLHRFVVTGHELDGVVDRGSVVFASPVSAGSVHDGDVISFRRPDSGVLVTRVVSNVRYGEIRTADAVGHLDPWQLPASTGVDRMVLHVPWVGYPFLGAVSRLPWLLLAALPASALLLALIDDLRRSRRPHRQPAA